MEVNSSSDPLIEGKPSPDPCQHTLTKFQIILKYITYLLNPLYIINWSCDLTSVLIDFISCSLNYLFRFIFLNRIGSYK